MEKNIVEFGRRMDSAQDKESLIALVGVGKHVLDLGAGTGAMARQLADKYDCYVDAVDFSFKIEEKPESDKVKYFEQSITGFLSHAPKDFIGKYDCVILSGVLHELNSNDLANLYRYLPRYMAKNCRLLIREPLFDDVLGPVLEKDGFEFINLVQLNIPYGTDAEYSSAPKISASKVSTFSPVFWANLAFVISYGKESWAREKHEYRYARSINWAKEFFNFKVRPFTGFQVYTILDTSYRQHFINAGIPGEAFDLLQYTGLHIIIDYSK